MTTLFKKELYDFAVKFVNILKEKELMAEFNDSSFRDYLVQISVRNKLVKLGKINVYYKPSKKSYSAVINVKDKDAAEIINICWDKANGFEVHDENSGIFEAFVDGSYINGKTGCGAVIFSGNKKLKEISKNIEDTSTRQFGGELCAVMEVIGWCLETGIKKIRINYDYLGIEYFVTGIWKPKNELAKKYRELVLGAGIEILWRKIDSHTGNMKNNIADRLAKAGANS